ncbi:shikimate dehydrogenase [Pokkaliibacter sp. CJK22405]|uniref:shikimate dehydrogenase n=1 Tax=Pokkaliibacter sp. CJK22405 TaxID=3384615 RepID=UPI003984CFD9
MDRYLVLGHPVAHSKSPWIHQQFAEQTGQDLCYDRQELPVDGFVEGVQALVADGVRGMNVTVPFKEQVPALCQHLSERVKRAGAANTVYITEEQTLACDNTDGIGMVRDMRENCGWQIAGLRVLVLGAGGAVRGVLAPLLAEKPAQLVIANRTASKAQALAELFADLAEEASTAIQGCGFDALAGQQFDLIINGTSASLQGDVPPLPADVLDANGAAYDMMYGAQPTAFLRWVQAHSQARCQDGLGMLVEQAAESFWIWRGVRPQTAPVIAKIRQSLLTG